MVSSLGRSGDGSIGGWRLAVSLLLALQVIAGPLAAADAYAPDRPEPGSVEAIARFTTDPRFVSPWVAYVPEADGVPSPTDYPGPHRGRCRRADAARGDLRLPAGAGRGLAAGASRRTSGAPRRGARSCWWRSPTRRESSSLSPAQGRHRRARRSAEDRPGARRGDHRRERDRSTTSTPASTPTRRGARRRCWSSPTGWPSPSSR